jgi:glycosyltransferase involved in cell wall biosynthesis
MKKPITNVWDCSKTLGIVIPTFGAWNYVIKAVRSAFDASETPLANLHVCIVDDASPTWNQWFEVADKHLDASKAKHLETLHFTANGGLIRGQNAGLQWARKNGFDYCCIANSDVIFGAGWDKVLAEANNLYDLLGPVTNAPGSEEPQQVSNYLQSPQARAALKFLESKSAFSDKPMEINQIARYLRDIHRSAVEQGPVNGFCLWAKTATWWDNAYDKRHVFCPSNDFNSKGQSNPTPLMTLSEYELQHRWRHRNLKTGYCPGAYVFHYRSVSRGEMYRGRNWYRMTGT